MSEPDSAEIERARRLFAGPCEFVAGATTIEVIPPPTLPEVAFVGRSNAGKSSLINALTGRTTLARVSHTPGRTRQINFFRLADTLMLVDLPGYSYAQVSKALAAQWQRLIFDYLRGRPNLKRVILLIDARRGIMDVDRQAMTLLDQAAVSYLVVLTKTDKLTAAERGEARTKTAFALKGQVAAYPDVLATSSLTADGLELLRCHIAALAGTDGFGL
ncbi:MAG TPA: ribosome biogenesis GTP-binding protein YihA/YsxC [Rhizomicrobium sp.]|nr:ribosome biogenesis GTP-binding protein YihA/YsxC [Rhizomicrobium sp.]